MPRTRSRTDRCASDDQSRALCAFLRAYIVCRAAARKYRKRPRFCGAKVARAEFETTTWALGLLGGVTPGDVVVEAQRSLWQIAQEFAAWTAQFDLVMTPTLARPPIRNAELRPRGRDALVFDTP